MLFNTKILKHYILYITIAFVCINISLAQSLTTQTRPIIITHKSIVDSCIRLVFPKTDPSIIRNTFHHTYITQITSDSIVLNLGMYSLFNRNWIQQSLYDVNISNPFTYNYSKLDYKRENSTMTDIEVLESIDFDSKIAIDITLMGVMFDTIPTLFYRYKKLNKISFVSCCIQLTHMGYTTAKEIHFTATFVNQDFIKSIQMASDSSILNIKTFMRDAKGRDTIILPIGTDKLDIKIEPLR